MSAPRFPYIHELTQSEHDTIMDTAVEHLKRCRKKPSFKESRKSDLQIEYEGLAGQYVFAEFTGLPFDAVWKKYPTTRRYNFETPEWRIKVAYRGKPHGFLYINHHHLANIHANIYVQAVGEERVFEITGWAYTEDFFKEPPGFQCWLPSGPSRGIEQDDLRPFGLLRKMLK